MPADPPVRPRPIRTPRRRLSPSKPSPRFAALAVFEGTLVGTLSLGWILQFGTRVCDHHPNVALVLALMNGALAIAAAWAALGRGVRPGIAIALASAVVLGALYVPWAKLSYRSTLSGAPGYTLPHQAYAYGPEAKQVTLETTDGVSLAATHLGSARGRGIVLMPGWASGRRGFAIASLAEWLSPRFDVLVVDPRGVGDSDGTLAPDLKSKFDLLAAAAYLNAQGDSEVGVLAERESALSAIVAASEQHSIRSLALADPSVRWGESPLRGPWFMDASNPFGRLYWRIGAGVRMAGGLGPETAEWLPRVSGIPMLLLGSKDDPEGRLRQLNLVAPEPRSMRLFKGRGDPLAWQDFQSYYHTVYKWFELSLSESTDPVSETSASSDSVSIPMGSLSVTIPLSQDLATP